MEGTPPKAVRTSEFYVTLSALLYTALAPILAPLLKHLGIEIDQSVLVDLVPWLLGGGIAYGGKRTLFKLLWPYAQARLQGQSRGEALASSLDRSRIRQDLAANDQDERSRIRQDLAANDERSRIRQDLAANDERSRIRQDLAATDIELPELSPFSVASPPRTVIPKQRKTTPTL